MTDDELGTAVYHITMAEMDYAVAVMMHHKTKCRIYDLEDVPRAERDEAYYAEVSAARKLAREYEQAMTSAVKRAQMVEATAMAKIDGRR